MCLLFKLTLEDPRRVHFGFGVAPEPVPRVPKEESDIYVRGGPNMRVGLLAVDKAVLFLREEHSLTREKVVKCVYVCGGLGSASICIALMCVYALLILCTCVFLNI